MVIRFAFFLFFCFCNVFRDSFSFKLERAWASARKENPCQKSTTDESPPHLELPARQDSAMFLPSAAGKSWPLASVCCFRRMTDAETPPNWDAHYLRKSMPVWNVTKQSWKTMVLLQNGRNVSKKTKKRTGIGSVAEERGEKGAIASSRRSSQAASMKSQYCLSLFCLFIS
jgi:hypothetical protein